MFQKPAGQAPVVCRQYYKHKRHKHPHHLLIRNGGRQVSKINFAEKRNGKNKKPVKRFPIETKPSDKRKCKRRTQKDEVSGKGKKGSAYKKQQDAHGQNDLTMAGYLL